MSKNETVADKANKFFGTLKATRNTQSLSSNNRSPLQIKPLKITAIRENALPPFYNQDNNKNPKSND